MTILPLDGNFYINTKLTDGKIVLVILQGTESIEIDSKLISQCLFGLSLIRYLPRQGLITNISNVLQIHACVFSVLYFNFMVNFLFMVIYN